MATKLIARTSSDFDTVRDEVAVGIRQQRIGVIDVDLIAVAQAVAKAAHYTNAGTIEFPDVVEAAVHFVGVVFGGKDKCAAWFG